MGGHGQLKKKNKSFVAELVQLQLLLPLSQFSPGDCGAAGSRRLRSSSDLVKEKGGGGSRFQWRDSLQLLLILTHDHSVQADVGENFLTDGRKRSLKKIYI